LDSLTISAQILSVYKQRRLFTKDQKTITKLHACNDDADLKAQVRQQQFLWMENNIIRKQLQIPADEDRCYGLKINRRLISKKARMLYTKC